MVVQRSSPGRHALNRSDRHAHSINKQRDSPSQCRNSNENKLAAAMRLYVLILIAIDDGSDNGFVAIASLL